MTTDIRIEDGRLVVTRIYNAPREAVFDAWVETSKVQQWWGCAQTTNVRSEIEPKVGGKYNHHMTLGEMGEHAMLASITEFDPPNRLAYTIEFSPDEEPGVATIEFTDHPDGTHVHLVHSKALPDEIRPYVIEGTKASFDKLERFFAAPV